MKETIREDPLFVGLTKPPLIFGVSFSFAMVNMMISTIIYIQMSSIKIIFIAFIIHMIGYILCFNEPLFIEIYANKAQNFTKCKNTKDYKGNSYYT